MAFASSLAVNAMVAQNGVNWTAKQLVEPAQLARILTAKESCRCLSVSDQVPPSRIR
jgi:hypothetical protein